jgi:hypothetical protein
MSASWKPAREDAGPLAFVIALPLLVALPLLLGALNADPMLYTGVIARGFEAGHTSGVPFIDPNSGYSTQALGRLAAMQWIFGGIPWWNPYSGVGLPLAAEYHPGAFFPLTMLLLLPKGMVLLQVALQMLAGAGTYGLLRQLGTGRLAATFGGVLFAFNGTLAWFAHAAAQPVPFLPWMLWGIERAFTRAGERLGGGWRMFAVAMAASLLAGFPETAYINGLLALAWSVVRGFQLPANRRLAYGARIAAGGLAGIAIAAPQVYAFFEFLMQADLGGHEHRFAHEALHRQAILPSLIAPYVFGPIMGYSVGRDWLFATWSGIGGYVTLAIVVSAALGWSARRGPLRWLLLAWIVLALSRTFGVELAATIWNLVPGISLAAFYRYAPPSWEFAFVILAAWGVDAMAKGMVPRISARIVAAGVLVLGAATAAWFTAELWPAMHDGGMRRWTRVALIWALLSALAVLALAWRPSPRRTRILAGLLAAEAVVMLAIPMLANPRAGTPHMPAIHFLRDNLGLQRFYTLGPIQPNYGAYFRVASINYNYLPNSKRWHDWVKANLDKDADSVVFNGVRGGPSSQEVELRRNLPAYQWAGVRYVVAFAGTDPLAGFPGVKPVYGDEVLRIFELPSPSPYFESPSGDCKLVAEEREKVTADCARAATLVRRELFHPGWTARVGDNEVPIAEHARVFQSIDLPAGKSDIRFRYAPPYVGWAWLAALAGLLSLAVPFLRRARRSAPSGLSAT